MTTLPISGYLSDNARTQQEMKDAFEDLREVSSELPGGAAISTLTIAAGVVTPTKAYHKIDTESADAIDDLDRINQLNHPDGRILILTHADPARLVVVKHLAGGSGQISTVAGTDIILQKRSRLILISEGATWVQMVESRIAGGATGTSVDFWASSLPPESVLMYGQFLDPAVEIELFGVLGTTYGGNGVTTFGIPDQRGRVAVGRDDMGSTPANRVGNEITGTALGNTGGSEQVALVQSELPDVFVTVNDTGHDHPITDPGHTHDFTDRFCGGQTGDNAPGVTCGSTTSGDTTDSNTTGITIDVNTTGITVETGGSDTPHSNLQPSIISNKIMWT